MLTSETGPLYFDTVNPECQNWPAERERGGGGGERERRGEREREERGEGGGERERRGGRKQTKQERRSEGGKETWGTREMREKWAFTGGRCNAYHIPTSPCGAPEFRSNVEFF